MPWQERSIMSQRQEFVALAAQEGANISALCAPLRDQPQDGLQVAGPRGGGRPGVGRSLAPPRTSPAQTSPAMEARILALRAEHPAWGGRKLHHRLVARAWPRCPAPSTITAILRRHGLLAPEPRPRDFVRFEHPRRTSCGRWTSWAIAPWTTGRVHP